MADRDPPEGYIGIGFIVETSAENPVVDRLEMAIEPDDVAVSIHDEPADDVVVIEFSDEQRDASADIVVEDARMRQLEAAIAEARGEAGDEDPAALDRLELALDALQDAREAITAETDDDLDPSERMRLSARKELTTDAIAATDAGLAVERGEQNALREAMEAGR